MLCSSPVEAKGCYRWELEGSTVQALLRVPHHSNRKRDPATRSSKGEWIGQVNQTGKGDSLESRVQLMDALVQIS